MRLHPSITHLRGLSSGVLGLVLTACASETPVEHKSPDTWATKVAKYGESNMANAPWFIAKFCMRGGLFDSTPFPNSGPYGFTKVDSLGLDHSDRKALVVHDITAGEGGWWRITFGLGASERYAFFINGRSRMASCGEAGLTSLRATFRPSGESFPGDALANEVYRARSGEYTDDVSGQPDDVICGLAVSQRYAIWESSIGYLPYVEEAKARGFTPQSCIALTGRGSE